MQKGDFVKLNYIGRLESGEIFDLTDEEIAKKENVYTKGVRYSPITIVIGAGFVIPGLDKALLEMKVGERKTAVIEPKDAFGDRDARLIKVVPQKVFRDQKVEIKQGMVVDFGGTKGRIQSVAAGRVTVDFNNPLAGKVLNYDVTVLEKVETTEEKIKGIFSFLGFHDAKVVIKEKEAIVTVALPQEIKNRISQMVLDNVKEIEKLVYEESFVRKAE